MKKNYFIKNLNKSVLTLSVVFCAIFAPSASAQNIKNIGWIGATNGNWFVPSNWNNPGITSVATYTASSATVPVNFITLAQPNSQITVGDKVSGYGIPAGTTVTAIDTALKKITISANTILAVGTPGTNVTFTYQTPRAADSYPQPDEIAVISNGANPDLVDDLAGAFNTVIELAGISITNGSGPITGSTLTIPRNVEIFVTSSTNEAVAIRGGNIVNNGLLSIRSTFTGGNNNTVGAFGMNFGLPSVVPTTATEYTYSGSGLLKIDTSAGSQFSGGISFSSADINAQNATYKFLLDGTFEFLLSSSTSNSTPTRTAATQLFRAFGTPFNLTTCKIILGGKGLNLGTTSQGFTNGIIAIGGGGIDLTIDANTTFNVISGPNNPTVLYSTFVAGATANPSFFRNKGTLIVRGSGLRGALAMGSSNFAINNFINDGTIDVDYNPSLSGQAAFATTNNPPFPAGTPAEPAGELNLTNNGIMTLKTSLNGAFWGAPINVTSFAVSGAFHLTNTGTLTLTGSNYNAGNRAWSPTPASATANNNSSRITNSGTLISNQELRTFYTVNTGTITFQKSVPPNTTKMATFGLPLVPLPPATTNTVAVAAASVGAKYVDAKGNEYTVAVEKLTLAGTTLVMHVNDNIDNPVVVTTADLESRLTKVSGSGDDSIIFNSLTTNGNNAFFQTTLNSGTINTFPGTRAMTVINGVRNQVGTPSILSPGGDSDKATVVFGPEVVGDFNLFGTLRLQVSEKTRPGVDYDFVRFQGRAVKVNLAGATLDVSDIYTPTEATTIDVLTTPIDALYDPNDLLSLDQSGSIVGNFATVTGIAANSGWEVKYINNITTPGKVQLSYDPTKNLSVADNAFAKFKFNYYPNPTSSQLNLSSEKNISKVELFNILGQKVQSNTVNASQKQLNIANLQKGMYMMEVSIENVKKTFKIVKQ